MRIVSISEAKATLSEQLRHVKRGETVVITERGRPIARVVPYSKGRRDAELEALEQAGLVRRGSGRIPKSFWSLPRPTDRSGSVRAAVLDDREAGW